MSTQSDVNTIVSGTLGALLLSYLVAYFVTGIATGQTCLFLRSSASTNLKASIVVLWCLLITQSGAEAQAIYYFAVTYYGKPLALAFLPASIAVSVTIGAVIAAAVQFYYAYRIYRFSCSPYIPIICVVGAVTDAVIFTYAIIAETISVNPTEEYYRLEWAAYTSGILRCVVDFILTAALCIYLTAKTHGNVKSTTRTVVNHVIVYTIQSGLLNWIITIATLIAYFKLPVTFVWISLSSFISRLSYCSLLSSLNARTHFQQMQQITNGQLLVTDLELQYGITFTTEDMRQINSPRGDESWIVTDSQEMVPPNRRRSI